MRFTLKMLLSFLAGSALAFVVMRPRVESPQLIRGEIQLERSSVAG